MTRRVTFTAGLILLVAVTLAIGVDAAFAARVYPGVHGAGIDLGGLVEADARARLEDAALTFAAAPVTVTGDGMGWTTTNMAIGVTLDTERAVAEALAEGKGANVVGRLQSLVSAAFGPTDVGWPRRAEGGGLDAFIDRVGRDADRDAVDADVIIATGGVELREARDGIRVDRQRLRAAILDTRTESLEISLPAVVIQPQLDATAVADTRRDAVAAYRPTRLVAGSESVTLSAEQIARLMRIDRVLVDDAETLVARADPHAVSELIDEASAQLDGPVRDAVLVAGEARLAILTGRDGVVVDRVAASAEFAAAIFRPAEGMRTIALPAEIVAPAFSTADAALIADATELAGAFTTYFPENAARATNIGNAARTFDGLVIGPGESFSFWDRIGEVSPRTGYVYAGTIIGGVSAQAIGGGLCQVSTTLFNAVARTGARIDERHEHSYYIERYPYGLDAAVFAPSLDLKWTNDTGVPLYLFGSGTDTSVSFWLYSAPTGRAVLFTDPVRANLRWPSASQPADPAHAPGYVVPGSDVWVSRIVSLDGAEISRDTWYSHYAHVWGGPVR